MAAKTKSKPTKATSKKRPSKPTARELALVKCAIFTLKVFGKKGGLMVTLNPKPMTLSRWQDSFFDALDAYGYEVDRDKFYESLERRKKKPREGR